MKRHGDDGEDTPTAKRSKRSSLFHGLSFHLTMRLKGDKQSYGQWLDLAGVVSLTFVLFLCLFTCFHLLTIVAIHFTSHTHIHTHTHTPHTHTPHTHTHTHTYTHTPHTHTTHTHTTHTHIHHTPHTHHTHTHTHTHTFCCILPCPFDHVIYSLWLLRWWSRGYHSF